MKFNEVTVEYLHFYLREDADDDETMQSIEMMLLGAKSFIRQYTGLTDEEMESLDDLAVVVQVLVSDMYDNRQYEVKSNNVNKVVTAILNMHRRNLL